MYKKKVCLTVIHHFCPVQKVSLEMLTLIVWLKHRNSDPLVRVASPDKQLINDILWIGSERPGKGGGGLARDLP